MTEELINLALIQSKSIKYKLLEINKNIKKTCKYRKNFFSYRLLDFALNEDILENVILLNMNKSTVIDSNYSCIELSQLASISRETHFNNSTLCLL